MFLTNVYAPEHKWSPMYPTFIQLWSAMIQWYSLFFCGLGNMLLETYKEEGLEERRMKMKMVGYVFQFWCNFVGESVDTQLAFASEKISSDFSRIFCP